MKGSDLQGRVVAKEAELLLSIDREIVDQLIDTSLVTYP
jgi:hypothetical protein